MSDHSLEEKTVKIVTADDCIIFMIHYKTISSTTCEGPMIRVKKTNHIQVDLSHIDYASLIPEAEIGETRGTLSLLTGVWTGISFCLKTKSLQQGFH